MARPRVLLADDHAEFLSLAADLLQTEFEVMQVFGSGPALLASDLAHEADLIVLDISMPEMSGLEVAQKLQTAGCPAEIIFLTVHAEHDYVDSAKRAGAKGYVVKQRLATDLVPALHAALAGRTYVSPTLAQAPAT